MMSHRPNVLALTFPVGIWDYLGWRDTLARPEYAARQLAFSERLHVRGRFTPQLIFNGVSQISAGATHSCGMTPAGVVYCWGSNPSGQLGDGSTTERDTPVSVASATAPATSASTARSSP